MPENTNVTQITPPRVAITDPRTGNVSREWYRWFYYLYELFGPRGVVQPTNGGTGTNTVPTDGQLLVGNGVTGTYDVVELGTGDGIAKTIGPGFLSIENTGVLSVSGGATGLTPSSPTAGDVTLDGTLAVAHGGTGQTSYTNGQLLIGNSTGNTLSKATLTQGSGVTITNGPGSITISATGTGGDVVGPSSATDNAIVRFDGTTGKLIQNGLVTIDDSGNAANINSLGFDTTPTTVPTAPGSLYWDDADGNQTLSLVMEGGNVIQQIGEEIYYRIKASSAITKGQVVMFTGTVGASGALTGAPATGLTAETASYVMGVATQNIALNGWGYVTSFGLVRGINTTGGAEAWTNGQILYLDPTVAGGLTKTVPTAPNPKVQVCAVVYASGGGAGSLFIRPTYGGKLGQFEGDVQVTTPASNDVLLYNGSKWINSPASTLPIGTATNADHIKTVSVATNANYYLTFVDSDNSVAAYESVYTDAGITYNPSTNSLTSGVSGGTF